MNSPKPHLIVFDMDGVIVDVSQSYRACIRRTARLFFQDAGAADELPDPLFSLEDLAEIKQSGGLNNDWETTYRVISLLLTRIDMPDVRNALENGVLLWRNSLQQCDLSQLKEYLQSEPYPLKKLLHSAGPVENRLVKRLSTGDVGSGNIIKQIFQELYLGKDLFESIYHLPAMMNPGDGLINRETLMTDRKLLQRLSRHHSLAIATGRPRVEAAVPLNRFNLQDIFSTVLTLDECIQEEKKREDRTGARASLSKPHPFMLNVIARQFAGKVHRNYYIGDMPDDMIAARRAAVPFVGIGKLPSTPDAPRVRSMLMNAGAHHVIEDLAELMPLLD